jgi:hypothetical protein
MGHKFAASPIHQSPILGATRMEAMAGIEGALPLKLVHSVKVSFLDVAARNPPVRFPPRSCNSNLRSLIGRETTPFWRQVNSEVIKPSVEVLLSGSVSDNIGILMRTAPYVTIPRPALSRLGRKRPPVAICRVEGSLAT